MLVFKDCYQLTKKQISAADTRNIYKKKEKNRQSAWVFKNQTSFFFWKTRARFLRTLSNLAKKLTCHTKTPCINDPSLRAKFSILWKHQKKKLITTWVCESSKKFWDLKSFSCPARIQPAQKHEKSWHFKRSEKSFKKRFKLI